MSDPNPKSPSTEIDDAMEAEKLFSSNPISYRMDRRSRPACDLRIAVSKKLFDFLGNYSDEVLAEYIVVLVCNGKHQIQARDDLEAFLGDESGKFVAWLWNHLSNENHYSKTTKSLDSEVKNCQQDDLSKEQDSHYSNISNVPEDLERWCPDTTPLAEDVTEQLREETTVNNRYLGASDCSRATKYLPSSVTLSPDIASGREQWLHYGNQNKKMARTDSSLLLNQSFSAPGKGQGSRGMRSVIVEDQLGPLSPTSSGKRRLHSTATDIQPHQIARPRGNVWDRLGKPCDEEGEKLEGNRYQADHYLVERGQLDNQNVEIRNSRLVGIVSDAQLSSNLVEKSGTLDRSHGKEICTKHFDESRKQMAGLPHLSNLKRKKLYTDPSFENSSASRSSNRGDDVPTKVACTEINRSPTVKYRHFQKLNEVTSEPNGRKSLPSRQSITSANAGSNLRTSKIPYQLNRTSSMINSQNLVSISSQLPSNSETPNGIVCGDDKSVPAKNEVLDVKARLRQVEMDMLKLRSKQVESSGIKPRNEAPTNGFSGTQNIINEEDLESRTILVTNVHFAASKEAILSHFSKCGHVLKVVMLTDTITAQPKGAAYVVFASKDSVDKAISLSGTSFFSRILKVTRKAEVPPDFLVPSQSPVKLLPPFFPQPYKKSPIPRPHTSSHLQWRREEKQLPAATIAVEHSNAGD